MQYFLLAFLILGSLAASSSFAEDQLTCSPQIYALDPLEFAEDPCAGQGTILLANMDQRRLVICAEGQLHSAYPFAGGKGGIGKTRQGDRKTPLGTYELGAPRPSDAGFGTFIPVQYPNAEDIAAGYSGGDIGLHGPTRITACMGRYNISRDWTHGCLAFASDATTEAIANFVSAHPEAKLKIYSEGQKFRPRLYPHPMDSNASPGVLNQQWIPGQRR